MLLPADRNDAALAKQQLHTALTQLETDAKDSLDLDLNMNKCALLLPSEHVLLE